MLVSKEIPKTTINEIRQIGKMKNNKAPWPDAVIAKMMKETGNELYCELDNIYNKCLEIHQVPKYWHSGCHPNILNRVPDNLIYF